LLKIDYPSPKVVAFTPILWLRHRDFLNINFKHSQKHITTCKAGGFPSSNKIIPDFSYKTTQKHRK